MVKKCICLVLVLLLLPLAGCWNYRGLDEITIVAGIAVDKDAESGKYMLSFEFVDIGFAAQNEAPESKILESEGKTLFEAIRMAKRKVRNKLYFGHTQIMVISQEIARKEDIGKLLDFVMRDGETRETMLLCISQEQTAQDVFKASGLDENILSIKLNKILETDNEITASTLAVEVYNAYDTINTPGMDLALAAVHAVKNGEESILEANGIAVFKDRKLVGYLTPEESRYYLFCVNKVKGGVFTFSSTGEGEDDAALEIAESSTKRSVVEENGQVKMRVDIRVICFLDEMLNLNVELDFDKVKELQELAAGQLKKDIEKLIKKVQTEYEADIFGFGNVIHTTNLKLWERIKNRWDTMYKDVPVDVKVEVRIANTAALGSS